MKCYYNTESCMSAVVYKYCR